MVSNIAANSEADAMIIAKSPLMTNLTIAMRDTAHEMRKEAVWAISNVVYNVKDADSIRKLIESEIMTLLLERL